MKLKGKKKVVKKKKPCKLQEIICEYCHKKTETTLSFRSPYLMVVPAYYCANPKCPDAGIIHWVKT